VKFKLASLAIGVLCVILISGYLVWQSLPLLLTGVVKLIPTSWEDSLGRAVVAGITRSGNTCDTESTKQLIDTISQRLQAAMPQSGYRFDIKVVRNPEVNALAAPGGHIVVFSGLIDKMQTPEQLAAVIAHEMQHVVQRHSTRGMMRTLGLQLVLSLVLGDVGFLGDLAGNLTVLHFMRSDEQSADDEALNTLMRAGIAPSEMQHAFENLERSTGNQPAPLKYLASHPPLSERIERVKSRGSSFQGNSRPIGLPMAPACR
jgi:beta-barrel assembly-enhancing protease